MQCADRYLSACHPGGKLVEVIEHRLVFADPVAPDGLLAPNVRPRLPLRELQPAKPNKIVIRAPGRGVGRNRVVERARPRADGWCEEMERPSSVSSAAVYREAVSFYPEKVRSVVESSPSRLESARTRLQNCRRLQTRLATTAARAEKPRPRTEWA
jgi:hypothetical protein